MILVPPARAAWIAIASVTLAGCDQWPIHHDYGPPGDPRVVQRLCASDLGGPRAELHVWRDDQRRVVLFEVIPDSDGPNKGVTALYDSRGREQLRMPPTDPPTSPQALETQRRRDAVIEDSKSAETLECGKDAGAAPPRAGSR